MKRKGFTLIELLAVIVILAIIALIATPIILNVIEKAKKGAAESSALGYIKAVENQVAINAVDTSKEDIVDGYYEVSALNSKSVLVKGNGPVRGLVKIDKGQVTACSLVINKYTVECLENGKVQVGEKEKYIDAIEVYYNPVLGEKCSASEAVSTTGTKEGCMKWYAYKDDGTNYTMILDHNTTPLVAWNSEGSNIEMKEVKIALENDTKNWNEMARLITADEVAKITGANVALDWTSDKRMFNPPVKGESISWFYLDGASGSDTLWRTQVVSIQGSSKYTWLFDNTNGCTSYGCNVEDSSTWGYWTSTSVFDNSIDVWRVGRGSTLYYGNVDYNSSIGIRPVITIPKTIIN